VRGLFQHRFVHIADCHIGAWREPKLLELDDAAFGKAIDLCIETHSRVLLPIKS
jgi:DNA repair exonuclease SbcCD nuclease subunit